MDAQFFHECGTQLILDFSQCFALRSPSARITTGGLSTTILEFTTRQGKGAMVQFYCSKCRETLQADSEEILTRCIVCRENKPVSSVYASDEIPNICEDCLPYVKDGKKNPPDSIKSSLPYIKISKSANLVSFSKIISLRII